MYCFFNRGPPREGANIWGLYMEGARWDTSSGGIVESKVKELFPTMPVIYIKAITQVIFIFIFKISRIFFILFYLIFYAG